MLLPIDTSPLTQGQLLLCSWFKSTHAAEVRLYAPYLIAEVVIQGGDMRDALSSGFRQVGVKYATAPKHENAEPVCCTWQPFPQNPEAASKPAHFT